MVMSERSSSTVLVRAKKHPTGLLVIAAMGTFTVATPFPLVFGLPRAFLIALLFTTYMFISLVGRVRKRYVQFALAYLAAFVPATLYNFNTVSVKWTSILQLFPMLVTFCVLGSYFERWLTRNSDRVQIRWLELLLLYFFVMSVLEMVFNSQFTVLRGWLYPAQSDLYSMLNTQRELSVYGGRPTVFFSEPSNFAKFLSIIVATYLIATKCSRKAIFVLIAFYLVVRSVSYFYAAPVMLLAFWQSYSSRHPAKERERRRKPVGAKLIVGAAVAVCLLVGVFITQKERISSALAGQDNSLAGRITLPMQYMLSHTDRLLAGYGLTPQEELSNFTIMTYAMSAGNLDTLSPMMAATSTTITFMVGVGVAGLAIFFIAMFLMQRGEGAWIAFVFLLANIINAGYNSSTTFVLSGLLMSLMVYQFSLAKEQRRLLRSDAPLVLQKVG